MDIFDSPEAKEVWQALECEATHQVRNPRLQVRFSAEDLLAETRARAFERRQDFRGTTAPELYAWLHEIMGTRYIDLWRAHAETKGRDFRREVLLQQYQDSSVSLERSLATCGPSPSSEAGRRERALAVQAGIGRLPEPERSVLVLTHYYDQSLRDITGLLPDMTLARVRRCLAHASELLERELAYLNEGPTDDPKRPGR